jgi:hypothetical protein
VNFKQKTKITARNYYAMVEIFTIYNRSFNAPKKRVPPKLPSMKVDWIVAARYLLSQTKLN